MRRILATMGDPAGIGPEVVLRACAEPFGDAVVVPVGSRSVFERVARRLGLPIPSKLIDVDSDVGDVSGIAPGVMSAAGARVQKAAFLHAVEEVASGHADAVVTAPWTKSLMPLIGEPTVGHTEILAQRFAAPDHVMMLAGPRLRVSLVTTHTSIREVPDKITETKIYAVTKTTAEGLMLRFGVERPRIAVLALNPHAGERGEMGREEIEVIEPAIRRLRNELQADISGPYPADTLFSRYANGSQPFDAVVCMYHDQGLIPLKALHFGRAINITLGLPILRTSVDHGSAYDIAWQGTADAGSMRYALQCAIDMAGRSA